VSPSISFIALAAFPAMILARPRLAHRAVVASIVHPA